MSKYPEEVIRAMRLSRGKARAKTLRRECVQHVQGLAMRPERAAERDRLWGQRGSGEPNCRFLRTIMVPGIFSE